MKKTQFILAILLLASPALADLPSLPAGLGGGESSFSEPSLPAGLFEGSDSAPSFDGDFEDDSLPFNLTGFVETRFGMRLSGQPYEKDVSIGEVRKQLQAEHYWGTVTGRLTADFIFDPVADRYSMDLDTGDGWVDLREAYLAWRATDFMDIKAGRQILTWGTGDLVFLNDMFPKDFDSFFIGRDEEYLKVPSDAVKTSLFSDVANLDVIYTPHFNSDRYADGARVSTYDPFSGGQTSTRNILAVDTRADWFDEDEIAARLYRSIGAYESALYFYTGYWKNPQGSDMVNMRATFPKLFVYGASVRGPVASGIGNVEVAYYDSREDRNGTDPYNPNDQFRFLIGYEQELARELTGGFQYNLERTLDYDELLGNSIAGSAVPEENRHVVTLRLTKMMMNQTLTLSLFNFWSPSDEDGYVRPKATYKIDDNWTAEVGGNIFWGEKRSTFYGQLEDNTNAYVSLRYSF